MHMYMCMLLLLLLCMCMSLNPISSQSLTVLFIYLACWALGGQTQKNAA